MKPRSNEYLEVSFKMCKQNSWVNDSKNSRVNQLHIFYTCLSIAMDPLVCVWDAQTCVWTV